MSYNTATKVAIVTLPRYFFCLRGKNPQTVSGAEETFFSPNKSDLFLYKDATDTVRLSHSKEGISHQLQL